MKLLPALLALLLGASVCGVDADDRVDLTTPIERNLPPEQNAYTIWKEVLPAFVIPDEPGLDEAFSDAVNFEKPMSAGPLNTQLAAWLRSKSNSLARLRQANQRGRCQFPEGALLDLTSFPISPALTAGKTELILARSHAVNGELERAVAGFLDMLRFGKLLCEADGAMIHALVGRVIQNLALTGLRETASRHDISSNTLLAMCDTLVEAGPTTYALRNVLAVELAFMDRTFGKDAVGLSKALASHGIRAAPALDQDATRLLLRGIAERAARNLPANHWVRVDVLPTEISALLAKKEVADMSGKFFAWWMIVGNNIAMDVEEPDWRSMRDLCTLRPNFIGQLFAAHEGHSLNAFINAFRLLRTETSLTRAYLLLRVHQLREKEWPAQLSDALPANPPPDVVLDYFSNQPLRYSRERGLLWSVGPDGTDNDGDPAKDVVLDLANPVKISKPQP